MGSVYLEPGSLWENPFTESFNSKLHDELLSVVVFETLLEAPVLAEDFRMEYNTYRPQSLGGSRHPSSPSSGTKTNPGSQSWWTTNRRQATCPMA